MRQTYLDIVARRRAFRVEGYCTLEEAGYKGDYITPYQLISNSADGPALVGWHWLDAATAKASYPVLSKIGYLPGIRFNRVLDLALEIAGLRRPEIYLTQAFHLLPTTRSEKVPRKHVYASFEAITQHELKGRRVVALGSEAAQACRKFDIACEPSCHPSARTGTDRERAAQVAEAIGNALRRS